MKNRDIYWKRYKIQETLYIGQWCLSPLRSYDFLEEIWFIGVKSLATAALCSFSSSSRSHGMNFAMTYFMPRSYMKTSDTVAFAIPRSASSSHTVSDWSLWIAARTHSTFSDVLLVAGLPECGSLSVDSQPSLKCLCHTFICAALFASSLKPSESSE